MKSNLLLVIGLLAFSCKTNPTSDPQFQLSGPQVGCGSFTVFKLSADEKSYLQIQLDAKDLQEETKITIQDSDLIKVNFSTFDKNMASVLCNDVIPYPYPDKVSEVKGVGGSLIVKVPTDEYVKYKNNQPYKVTIDIKSIEFEDGSQVTNLKIDNVLVGWMPG